jgi:putative tryptophan/tyrosine transport system substrate-binding protein
MMQKASCLVLCALLFVVCGSAQAQQPKKIWRIGSFHVGLDHVPPSLEPLRQELKKLGYEEAKNLHFDWRNLSDQDAANVAAKDFVRNRVDVIVAFESQTIRAAKAATSEIPIVMVHVNEPVTEGFVKSIAHPGGNITGFGGAGDIPAKQIELFKEVVPQLRRVLVLVDPKDPSTQHHLAEIRTTAKSLKLTLLEREAMTQPDIERVFSSLKEGAADGVFIASPNLRTKFPTLILRLSSEKRLPLAIHRKELVEQGALFSYAHDLAPVGRLAAQYVDRILKGANPADLPFQEPSYFELVINLKTAKQIGLTIPPNVLARADRVIK